MDLFKRAGKILSIGHLFSENQLRGHFIIEGEKINLRVSLALTPEHIPLIQSYQLKAIEK